MPTRRYFLHQLTASTTAIALPAWLPSLFAETPVGLAALPRSTPEAEGVASAGIMAFLDGIAAGDFELHSLMVLRHGKVVAEGWWAPYAAELRHTMYSMSKSFTSTAVGFAVAEGKLTVEDKVTSFFPDDLPEKISDNLAALRVKHLLSMAVGSEVEPTHAVVESENWVRSFLAHKISHEPGTQFMYNSVATYMCSAIVQKVTGQTVLDYLTPRLFEPLGVTGMTWETCPRGINTGGWGLSIRTEGLAKFGQLYLQKGQWQGKQLLPATWIEEATTFKIQQPGGDKPDRPMANNDWLQGYGYQFWRCQHNGFRGDGAFGQFTIVLPEQDAVVVMTSENKNMQGELDLVYEHLLPAMKPTALPTDEVTQKSLKQRLSTLSLATPKGQITSPVAGSIAGLLYKLDANALGLTSVHFESSKTGWSLVANVGDTEHSVRCGLGAWVLGATAFPGTPPRLISGGKPKQQPTSRVAGAATWTADNTLQLTWRYYETPHHDTLTCVFDGDKVSITFLNSITGMSPKGKDTRPVLMGHVVR
jgi:CubicO group peptidase (beta-lactamase class C family)